MPITLTPPGTERRNDKLDDHGNGRRPPKPPRAKRTGGNGDGDNWNDATQGQGGPRAQLSTVRMGMFFAIFAVMMVFVAIASAFFVAKSSYHVDAYSRIVNSWHAIQLPRILWLNTAVIVLSSFTAEMARRAMFQEESLLEEWFGLGRPNSHRATVWLALTLVLGLGFVAGQVVAWLQLNAQLLETGPAVHYFYLITMLHALHLVVGIGALATAIVVLFRSRALLTRQIYVDATVWYWHAMGALWIILFALLEFCQ
ncbi:MAG: cytochrome c oxidase subunit 3 [Acidobacteriaceae bacterium]